MNALGKRRSGKKRTISPEQQAKMQAARRNAKVRQERVDMAREAGLDLFVPQGYTEQVLSKAKRR